MLGKKRINYIIKKPGNGRNSFSILTQTTNPDKTREYKKYKDLRIDTLNKDWKFSDKSDNKKKEILKLVKEIRKELNDIQRKRDGRDRIIKNLDNEEILNDFFEDRINPNPDTVSKHEMKLDFFSAVQKLENLSLKTARKNDLQNQINKIEKNSIQRRTCSRINSLLSFYGRKMKLLKRKDDTKPFIISETDFKQLLFNIQAPRDFKKYTEDVKNLFVVLYYTGLRIGEAFALQTDNTEIREYDRKLNYIVGNHVYVNSQMLQEKVLNNIRKNKFDTTKTDKERISVLYPNKLMKRIDTWVNLPISEKEKIRDIGFSYVIKKAFEKTFPNKKKDLERIKAHDCRHSYATNMLSLGLNISQIAKLLGNGVNVSEKYYLPSSLTPESLELIERTIQKNKKVG